MKFFCLGNKCRLAREALAPLADLSQRGNFIHEAITEL